MTKRTLYLKLVVLSFALFCFACSNSQYSYKQEIELARKCWENKNEKDTFEHLNNAIKINPRKGEAYKWLAGCHLASKYYRSAIKLYSAAIKRNYETAYCYAHRGYSYHVTGWLRKAESDYHFALRGNFKDKEYIYVNLSDIYLRLGNRELCRSYIDKALEINPKNLFAIANRAELNFNDKKFADALKDINSVISGYVKNRKKVFRLEQDVDVLIFWCAYKAELLDRLHKSDEASDYRKYATKLVRAKLLFDRKSEKRKKVCSKLIEHLEAPHLELYSNKPGETLEQYRRHASRYLRFVDREYFVINSDFKPTLVWFVNKQDFDQFCREQFNRTYKLGGFYQSSWDMLTFYDPENYTLLQHELTHALSDQHLLLQEKWAIEGIAELFGIAYIDDGKTQKLDLKRSFMWLDQKLKSKNVSLLQNVSSVVRMNKRRHESHLVATFLLHHNKLKKYLELARTGYRKGYPTVFEAAFDKNMKELEPMWFKYLDEVFPKKTNKKNQFGSR